MIKYDDNAVVLKHEAGTRLFHWGLILGFLPTAFTGIAVWLKPFSGDTMNVLMLVHIAGAWVLSLACVLFFIFRHKRVVAFGREIFNWTKDDFEWMKVSGGYPQKMFFGKIVPVPAMRKMNSGQKMMGIIVLIGTILVVVTGWILYVALPMVPKDIAFYADLIHLIIGLGLTVCVVCGHIVLSIYNWKECICMFGDGTMRVNDAKHHNELWVNEDIEPVETTN